MKLLPKNRARIEIKPEADRLCFNVTYDLQKDLRLTFPFIVVWILWQSWAWFRQGHLLLLMFSLIVAAIIAVQFFLGSAHYSAKLEVRAFAIKYDYSIGGGRRRDQILADDVRELDFDHGSKSQFGRSYDFGLYSIHGRFSRTCILPLLSDEQASQIRDLILDKFPQYSKTDPSDHPFTVLGLS